MEILFYSVCVCVLFMPVNQRLMWVVFLSVIHWEYFCIATNDPPPQMRWSRPSGVRFPETSFDLLNILLFYPVVGVGVVVLETGKGKDL